MECLDVAHMTLQCQEEVKRCKVKDVGRGGKDEDREGRGKGKERGEREGREGMNGGRRIKEEGEKEGE